MTRRCSHCSNNGHNSRTCPTRGCGPGPAGLKLFGVRLTDGPIIKKSASMSNLSSAHYHSSSSAAASPNPGSPLSDHLRDVNPVPDGYLSDDPASHGCTNRRGERKKGIPWTEEEHRLFLIGLQKLGKGDWRGIARNYVTSRTPTQVASHAQKYFIRQSNATRRKRRSSLFDIVPDDMATDTPSMPEEQVLLPCSSSVGHETENSNNNFPVPSLNLSLNSKFESMEPAPQEPAKEPEESVIGLSGYTPLVHGYFPPYPPAFPYAFWPPSSVPSEEEKYAETSHHQVLKPIPMLRKDPVNVEELVGMSQLSIGESGVSHWEASPLSLKMLQEPSRQSAFHASTSVGSTNLSKGETNIIQAV